MFFFFRQQNLLSSFRQLFSQVGRFFAKWGLFFTNCFDHSRVFLLRTVSIGSVHIPVIPTYLHVPPSTSPPPKKN